jgi:hypothetical protein
MEETGIYKGEQRQLKRTDKECLRIGLTCESDGKLLALLYLACMSVHVSRT